MNKPSGKVYLVGSGPGDPALITLRGCQVLARADAVLYDYLVNPQILTHARPGADLVCLGRHGQGRLVPQEEINRELVRRASEGQRVVRLKAGDPVVFAHAAEEIAALTSAQIPYEIVPGITAALAVGSYAAIPLTQGDAASAVALVTGQEREDKPTAGLDFGALASFPGTLVFYMGMTTAQRWTAALILAGKSPSTPAAIVRRCSWPDQETIRCTLGTVWDEICKRHLRPPALVIVGAVAAIAPDQDWLVARPLANVRVLVTRPAGQIAELAEAFADLGATAIAQPAIEIGPPEDWGQVDRALAGLSDYDWLVFSSANGVHYFLERMLMLETRDMRALAKLELAAIGPGTAEELARYRLRADLLPADYRAESLAEALEKQARGKRFLLVRASRGREVLAESLSRHAARVDQAVAYTSRDVARADPHVARQLAEGRIDWITVTSSAIARSLVKLFGQDLKKARLASISPITSQAIRLAGFEIAAEADVYTTAGLVEAVLRAQAISQPNG